MAVIIFGFAMLIYIIFKQGKEFNRSIRLLESRINHQEDQINRLNGRLSDLEK